MVIGMEKSLYTNRNIQRPREVFIRTPREKDHVLVWESVEENIVSPKISYLHEVLLLNAVIVVVGYLTRLPLLRTNSSSSPPSHLPTQKDRPGVSTRVFIPK